MEKLLLVGLIVLLIIAFGGFAYSLKKKNTPIGPIIEEPTPGGGEMDPTNDNGSGNIHPDPDPIPTIDNTPDKEVDDGKKCWPACEGSLTCNESRECDKTPLESRASIRARGGHTFDSSDYDGSDRTPFFDSVAFRAAMPIGLYMNSLVKKCFHDLQDMDSCLFLRDQTSHTVPPYVT
jgi:hypothetical protein